LTVVTCCLIPCQIDVLKKEEEGCHHFKKRERHITAHWSELERNFQLKWSIKDSLIWRRDQRSNPPSAYEIIDNCALEMFP
jgi:hypothetical protein